MAALAGHHPEPHPGSDSCPICLKRQLENAESGRRVAEREVTELRRSIAELRRRLDRSEDSNRVLRRVRDELQGRTT